MIAPDDPAQALDAIVEEAFRVLPAHALTDLGVCGCPVCMSIEDQASAARMDWREIPDKMMGSWLGSVPLDDDPVPIPVAEHLGPRLLMLIRDEPRPIGLDAAFDSVRFGDRKRFPGERGTFLDRAAFAILDRYRGARPRAASLDETLCMLIRGGFDVPRLLSRVETWPDGDLVGRLWSDWARGRKQPEVRRTEFWNDGRLVGVGARRAVGAWYSGPAVRAMLDRILETVPHDDPDRARVAAVEVALAATR